MVPTAALSYAFSSAIFLSISLVCIGPSRMWISSISILANIYKECTLRLISMIWLNVYDQNTFRNKLIMMFFSTLKFIMKPCSYHGL